MHEGNSESAFARVEARMLDTVEQIASQFGFALNELELDKRDGSADWTFTVPEADSTFEDVVADIEFLLNGAPARITPSTNAHTWPLGKEDYVQAFPDRAGTTVQIVGYDDGIMGGW